MNKVEVVVREDPSVQELLDKTAGDLQKKYNKQRKINEKFLKKKTPLQKVFSIFLDIVCISLLLFAFVVCFSVINTTFNGFLPNFAGYSNLVVSTESMVASGFEVGDIFIVHSVDTSTLNVNDKIAFYNYQPSYYNLDTTNFTDISTTDTETKYTLSIGQLFGFQTESHIEASKAKCDIIFHHIRAVYMDENGDRWFKTYGSSNSGDDPWYIHEDYIVGIQDEGILATTVLSLVDFVSQPYGLACLAVPVVVLMLTLIFSFLKSFQIAKLELDCVEEKRKITDPICVKNKVGYQMDNKTKLKILAQATDDNKDEYMNLLWKNGSTPASIKKYYQRKKLTININKDLLSLNRECEKMFKKKVKPTKIAKYYMTEKKKIEDRKESIRKRLKSIDRYKKIESNKK